MEEKQRLLNLKVELEALAKAEEISWKQKLRCKWLKDADTNTKYFLSISNSYRTFNNIDKLREDGGYIEDKAKIKEEIYSSIKTFTLRMRSGDPHPTLKDYLDYQRKTSCHLREPLRKRKSKLCYCLVPQTRLLSRWVHHGIFSEILGFHKGIGNGDSQSFPSGMSNCEIMQ